MKDGLIRRAIDEIPSGARKVATKRARSFAIGYAKVIEGNAPISPQVFLESCYLQGCEDMALAIIGTESKQEVDFQI